MAHRQGSAENFSIGDTPCGAPYDDERLAAIRKHLGALVSHPGAIDVSAEDGKVRSLRINPQWSLPVRAAGSAEWPAGSSVALPAETRQAGFRF